MVDTETNWPVEQSRDYTCAHLILVRGGNAISGGRMNCQTIKTTSHPDRKKQNKTAILFVRTGITQMSITRWLDELHSQNESTHSRENEWATATNHQHGKGVMKLYKVHSHAQPDCTACGYKQWTSMKRMMW